MNHFVLPDHQEELRRDHQVVHLNLQVGLWDLLAGHLNISQCVSTTSAGNRKPCDLLSYTDCIKWIQGIRRPDGPLAHSYNRKQNSTIGRNVPSDCSDDMFLVARRNEGVLAFFRILENLE